MFYFGSRYFQNLFGDTMELDIFNLKVNDMQKQQLKKLLSDIKNKNRHTYPEIIIIALKAFKAGLQ